MTQRTCETSQRDSNQAQELTEGPGPLNSHLRALKNKKVALP